MQAQEMELPSRVPSPHCLSNLDAALNELGMLATPSSSRREYLNEVKLNMVSMNSEYVSKVSIKGCKREMMDRTRTGSFSKQRYKPYKLPKIHRHRTKSENNETGDGTANLAQVIVEECINQSLAEINQLKKAKSLETIIASCSENEKELIKLNNLHFGHFEVEKVSDSIQNLNVNE